MGEHTPDIIHKKIRGDIPESELVQELRQAGYSEDNIKHMRILRAVHQELRLQEKNKKIALSLLALFVLAGAFAYILSPGPAPSSEQGTKAMSFSVKNDLGSGLDGASLMVFDREKHVVFEGNISSNTSLNLGGEEYTYVVSCPDGYRGVTSGTKKAGGTGQIIVRCKIRESNGVNITAEEAANKSQIQQAIFESNATPNSATTPAGATQSSPEEAAPVVNSTGGNATVAGTPPATDAPAIAVVSVAGAPPGWQNTDAFASVNCSILQGECQSNTYRLKEYSSSPGSCPTEYSQYTQASPATISSHAWVCASAKDSSGNATFSIPFEFNVDKNPPSATSSHTPLNPTTSDTLNITISATDDIGLSEIKIYVGGALKKTCAVSGVSASCIYSSSYPAATYSYNATIKDLAGNTKNTQLGQQFTASLPADTTPPAIILNLAAGNPTPASINLTWTSPGDDGSSGTAAQYDIRYSTAPLTEDTWPSATQASGEPAPKPAGSSESFTISGLAPNTAYYIIIKTADEAPNWSGLSNRVLMQTLPQPDATPPSAITLMAGDKTPDSVALAWVARGDDGTSGTATQYDLRYSTSTISESNWGSATQVPGEPAPKSSGSTETFTVGGLNSGTTYYFAIKVADEIPNWSGLSNSPSGATTSQYTIKVLDLSYIPTVNGKVDISLTGDWRNENIDALLSNIDSLRNGLIDTLVKGSKYLGYKDPSATAVLNYNVIEKKVFYTPVPPSATFKGMDNAPSADHIGILNGLNICNYVESQGVNEVWIWMYHTSQVAPIESNMAGPYGDISNSYRENDLPVCAKTYTVYDYNYGRSYSMAVEDHTHQIEALLYYVDSNLFWNLFVGTNNGGGRCGWTHYPPNGVDDYDWNNENNVLSDCEDWKPDGSGQKKWTNCRTWSTNPSACDNDEGLSFKTWWMQNIPGKSNSLYYNGKKLKNWWMFMGDFDRAMSSRTLVYG